MNWDRLADDAIAREGIDHDAALAVVQAPDDELLPLLHAAFRVRRHHHGMTVRLHRLRNAKSGVCPEDCSFCSQSLRFGGDAPRYRMQTVEELVAGAREAARSGAATYCMVTATRGPSGGELSTICEAARRIKAELPLRLCASLGLIDEPRARALAEAGVDRYNHNLETSARFFPEICTSHTFDDRVATLRAAAAAGMEACCGGIIGLGESPADRVDLALALRELRVHSLPVNFLDPRSGTPLGGRPRLRPQEALRALAMFRLANPRADVRVAGGREACLGALQPLALYAATSLFVDGYLTTGGQGQARDLAMIADAGFEVEAPAAAPGAEPARHAAAP